MCLQVTPGLGRRIPDRRRVFSHVLLRDEQVLAAVADRSVPDVGTLEQRKDAGILEGNEFAERALVPVPKRPSSMTDEQSCSIPRRHLWWAGAFPPR